MALSAATHAPDQNPLPAFSLGLGHRVFAGCCQPLLGVGPSRHYLCNPCVGAWTPTPQCPPSAFARFFPGDNGLTLDVRRSAHQNYPCKATSTGNRSRGCSHSLMFRLPRSLGPQVAPTAEALSLQGSRAVYTTHSSGSYLPRDVASLGIRHEQLIRLDLTSAELSRSLTRWIAALSAAPTSPRFTQYPWASQVF